MAAGAALRGPELDGAGADEDEGAEPGGGFTGSPQTRTIVSRNLCTSFESVNQMPYRISVVSYDRSNLAEPTARRIATRGER